jgi:hypothetical protein
LTLALVVSGGFRRLLGHEVSAMAVFAGRLLRCNSRMITTGVEIPAPRDKRDLEK